MARAPRGRTDAVRPLRRDFRRSFLSSLRRTGDAGAGRAGRANGMAVPALRHPVSRKFLSALRPPDGGVGLPAACDSVRRTNRPLDPVDARPGRLHHLRDHGLRRPRGSSRVRRPGHPDDRLRADGEQRLRLDAGNWTFDPLGTGSAGIYRSAAGHPDGFLDMSLPSSGARGYWWQAFRVDGSVPFTGAVHLDLQISGGLTSGRLIVAVDSANSPPDPRIAIGLVNFTGPTSWTAMPRFLADDRLTDPGIYYLKIAFFADSATTPVSVGFDNVRLAWTTDAAVVVYLPSPAPFVLFFTQDKTLFISYFAFLAAVIFLAAGYHLIRERREAWNAFRAPLEA